MAKADQDKRGSVLVTGANGGIGLAWYEGWPRLDGMCLRGSGAKLQHLQLTHSAINR